MLTRAHSRLARISSTASSTAGADAWPRDWPRQASSKANVRKLKACRQLDLDCEVMALLKCAQITGSASKAVVALIQQTRASWRRNETSHLDYRRHGYHAVRALRPEYGQPAHLIAIDARTTTETLTTYLSEASHLQPG